MLYYIASAAYQQIIMESCRETDQIVVGFECKEDLYLQEIVKEHYQDFANLESIIIDLEGIKDDPANIIAALDMLRIINSNARIIILAAHRQPGDKLLSQCFQMAIYDIVATSDFLDIKEQIKLCINNGKQYKDSVIFKDAINDIEKFGEQPEVDHVTVGIVGAQSRIGVTHTSIMFANYLRKRGYIVALVEMNESGDFKKIAESFSLQIKGDSFTKNGIDYYINPTVENIEKKAYNFLIFDFGNAKKADMQQFKNLKKQIVVSGIRPWEECFIQDIFSMMKYEELQRMYFYFGFCPVRLQGDVKSGMSELADNSYFVPLTDDPFESKDLPGIDTILAEYFPQDTSAKKRKK